MQQQLLQTATTIGLAVPCEHAWRMACISQGHRFT